MKSKFFFMAFALSFFFLVQSTHAQVAISASGSPTPDGSSILDLQSTELGFLVPRMTEAQRNAISNPATGLIIYQTDGATPGLYFNYGDHFAPDWNHVTDEDTPLGYWTQDGTLLYYNDGNVGIGTSSPGTKLDVNGAAWFVDSVSVSGRPGRLFLNGETNYEPAIRFAYEGTSQFKQYIWEPGSNPYLTLAAAPYEDQWGISPFGAVWHEYYGSTQSAYRINSSAATSNLSIANDNGTGGRGINVSMSNTSNTSSVLGVASFAYGDASAIYADSDAGPFAHMGTPNGGVSGYFASGDNWGRLGSQTSGVYGVNVIGCWGALGTDDPLEPNDEYGAYGDDGEATPKYGGLGTTNHGAYGKHTNQHWGALGTSSYGAYGENDDGSIGVLGDDDQGVYGRSGETGYHWGAIGVDGDGGTDYGVYGSSDDADPNFGGLGTDNYGAYGEYSAEEFFGALGADDAGVYGYLGGSGQNLDDGDYAVIGRGVENSTESGSDYSSTGTIGGVKGYNNPGVAYGFGVAGYTTDGNNRTGGVLGYLNSTNWGSLGYRTNAGANYGAYFTAAAGTGTGKSQSGTVEDIGLGVYGDLFGAHINGNVYGLYASGENYGIYADGDMYRTGADVHLQPNASGQNTVMYTQVSTEMTVQTYGIGQLQGGKSSINFDAAFSGIVSENEPIIVTITPIGQSNGVFLEKVDGRGFNVVENNDGKSNVQFSWIAIGKRAGYENMSLPEDVIALDYNNKIERGLANDNISGQDAEGLYYQNGQLYVGTALSGRTTSTIPAPEAKALTPLSSDRNGVSIPDAKPIKRDEKSIKTDVRMKPATQEKGTADSEYIKK